MVITMMATTRPRKDFQPLLLEYEKKKPPVPFLMG